MNLSKNLNYLLKLNSITPQDLCEFIKIDRSTFTRILNNSTTKPRLETIHSIAQYFEIDVQTLLNEDYTSAFKLNLRRHPTKTIKSILTELMQKTGLYNITLLHKHTGIPQSVISDILNEKTEKPNIKTMQKLSDFFGITIPQLCGIDPINNYKIANTVPSYIQIPILTIQQVQDWIHGNLTQDNISQFTHTNIQIIGNKSFALNINNDEFAPDFLVNQILVIDNTEIPKNGDYIIASVKKNSTYLLFELLENDGTKTLSLRYAGNTKRLSIAKDSLFIGGVVVQQIINKKN